MGWFTHISKWQNDFAISSQNGKIILSLTDIRLIFAKLCICKFHKNKTFAKIQKKQ